MIVYRRLWKDLVFHYLVAYLIAVYFRKQLGLTHNTLLLSSLVATALITLVNRAFFPQMELRAILKGEGFQGCTQRWGMKPCDCPFKDACPHRRMCEYNASR